MFQKDLLPETCRVLYQNKVEKYCILLAFIIRTAVDTEHHCLQCAEYRERTQILL